MNDTFVTPYGDKSHLLRREGGAVERMAQQVMALEVQTSAEVDAQAIRAMETVSEKSTPSDRAYATAILGGVLLLALGGVVLALWLLGAGGAIIGGVFILGAVVSVVVLLWLNAEYSPIGAERYKARTYHRIRALEIDADVQKAEMKYRAFMEVLGRVYGD